MELLKILRTTRRSKSPCKHGLCKEYNYIALCISHLYRVNLTAYGLLEAIGKRGKHDSKGISEKHTVS